MKFSVLRLVLTASAILAGGPLLAQKGVDLESELPPDAHHLKIGDAAPDFSLKGVDGKTYTLADFKDSPVLMVVFLSDHCPYSHAAETRLLPLVAEMKSRGLGVVAIMPNNPDSMSIGELGYTKYGDSYEDMKLYAKEQGFTFPYLYDGDKQTTPKAYGCLCTPEVFLFDRDRKLRYMGRFDDSRFAETNTVHSADTRNAVEEMLAGKLVTIPLTKPFGCSTKWIENKAALIQVDEKMYGTPVVLETIDATNVAALARNPTKKLRLINVWATWCVPCVREFPGIVSLSHRFANRDFEVITISVDDPNNEAKVKQFLDQQHATVPNRVQRSLKVEGRRTNNYLYAGASMDDLMKAIDPDAPGPVPYTVLIAPGGKILYHRANQIDVADLSAKIVDQLGAYYSQ
ncbi:MAG: redoxin domain-containing protein [Verrucomicrobia bacterium]|nr:redoxin domain-containing protein [Verrucomicrobiota bacterium]